MVLGLSFELNKSAVKDDFLEQLEKFAHGLDIPRYEEILFIVFSFMTVALCLF